MENKIIIITSEGDTLDSMIDQRFGRCRHFLVVDTENNELVKAVENQGAIQGHGAGIKAAQQVGELNVGAVITGQIGPNAAEVLNQLGIRTYHASGIVKDAVDDFSIGKLDEINKTAEPHSGMELEKEQGKQMQRGQKDEKEEKTGERIFFPLLDDNGMDSLISSHFGHAPFFGLYDTAAEELKITDNTLSHTDPDKSPVDQIIEAVNPTIVFAQGIGAKAVMLFNEKGIALKTGPYEKVKDALANLDKLEEQTSDCGHGHQ